MFHLIRNNELELQLDVSGVEDHLPSIAFDMVVSWNMPYQKVNLIAKECWFECTEWDKFEESIQLLTQQDSGRVILKDLSQNQLISFIKSGSELITEIQCKDTLGIGLFTLRTNGFSVELSEIYSNMKQLDKWW